MTTELSDRVYCHQIRGRVNQIPFNLVIYIKAMNLEYYCSTFSHIRRKYHV
jgi:hypothetical protein